MKLLLAIVISTLQFSGNRVGIEKGILDGFEPGDRGRVYYVLEVNDRQIRIDSTWAVLQSCRDNRCEVQLEEELEPGEGYFFELELAEERTSTARLAGLVHQRLEAGDLESAESILPGIRARGDDGKQLASRLAAEISQQRAQTRKQQQIAQLFDRAADALEARDLQTFPGLISQLQSESGVSVDRLESLRAGFDRIRGQRMVRIAGGAYTIGVDALSARFYNQTPQFQSRLEPFWIDRWPATQEELASGVESGTASGPQALNITWEEADSHCRALGKRLPTEFEWEAAAQQESIVPPEPSEWTSSWYLPYPGNNNLEKEFGEIFKVLRGGDSRGQSETVRFFMSPTEKAADVGFRCADEDIPR